MLGNPVKTGDGSATVSGDKPPYATCGNAGKAGVRFAARSQETGPSMLVRSSPTGLEHFSAQEKDEASGSGLLAGRLR